jgi:hypothetical protein
MSPLRSRTRPRSESAPGPLERFGLAVVLALISVGPLVVPPMLCHGRPLCHKAHGRHLR